MHEGYCWGGLPWGQAGMPALGMHTHIRTYTHAIHALLCFPSGGKGAACRFTHMHSCAYGWTLSCRHPGMLCWGFCKHSARAGSSQDHMRSTLRPMPLRLIKAETTQRGGAPEEETGSLCHEVPGGAGLLPHSPRCFHLLFCRKLFVGGKQCDRRLVPCHLG